MPTPNASELAAIANRLRILSIQSTTVAGSGHPTTCCSAADLTAALFFGHMRFDPARPRDRANDRFVFSKGHAAPLLYAAWSEAGHIDPKDLLNLRKIDSDLEGHPTPRLDFVDVATGSLGQGLSAGLGMAIAAKMDHLDYRTYVVMGDGELAEGSVWEAASLAGLRVQNNLVGIVDANRFGQSQETAFGHHIEVYQQRFESFGWETVAIDGHDMPAILSALEASDRSKRPFMIIAKTLKGKGIPVAEGKPGWHGKVLSAVQAKEAITLLEPKSRSARDFTISKPKSAASPTRAAPVAEASAPNYKMGEAVATRKAFGNALARIGASFPELVVLDADVENSTYTDEFGKKFPDRFVECFIAEQNMVGISTGLSAMGKDPFSATFAAFYSRAFDQIRMSAISMSNLKLAGSHSGISIGEDGPSQMALEDLASMRAVHGSTVLYPSDAMSTERLTEIMASKKGIFYLRTTRAETPVIYPVEEKFEVGGAKILRQSAEDVMTVIAAGVTLFEALKAADALAGNKMPITVIDAYSVKPLARDLILGAIRKTKNQAITVEDHYAEGGLGDAVAGELSHEGARIHKLAVRELPRSGKKDELMTKYGIDSAAIVAKVREICAKG